MSEPLDKILKTLDVIMGDVKWLLKPKEFSSCSMILTVFADCPVGLS